MSDEFTIRPYRPEADFEGMFAVTREIVGLSPLEEARRELREYPAKEIAAVVLERAQKIVGFCSATYPYWNRICIMDYLVVAPEHRGKGLGERLVRAVEAMVMVTGMRRICVQTISWNTDGIRFYERLGYALRGSLPGYFDDEHEMVWLDRSLEADPGSG
jgi:ribosomal protein S18 acetylase RimI-like enzyme